MLQLEILQEQLLNKRVFGNNCVCNKKQPKRKKCQNVDTMLCVCGGGEWKRSVGYWKCLCDLMLNFAWAKKGKRLWIMINTWFLLECQEWGKKWQKMIKWKLPVKLKLLKSCLLWDWQLYWKLYWKTSEDSHSSLPVALYKCNSSSTANQH